MSKHEIKFFFFFFNYKKLKKACFVLNKKALYGALLWGRLTLEGKKSQGLCTLRFALKHVFNNTAKDSGNL